jgi:hypothetical protein
MIMACWFIHAALESSIRYDATLASCKGNVCAVDPHLLAIEKAARKCAFVPPQVVLAGGWYCAVSREAFWVWVTPTRALRKSVPSKLTIVSVLTGTD